MSQGAISDSKSTFDNATVQEQAKTVRLFAVVPTTPDLSVEERLDALCRDLAPVASNAVDALEIAVSLEVRGIGDQNVREDFDRPDVFALAEEIHQRVARAPREPEAGPSPWRATPGRCILHGLLYGLPALCWPASAPLASGKAALALLIVSILLSWALSQSLSYLGYVHLGVDDTRDARLVLRWCGAIGFAVAALTLIAVAAFAPSTTGTLLFAIGQASYLIGATVLMVLGVERWLLLALAPGVGAGAAFLLAGQPAPWFPAVWACMSATVVIAVLVAAWFTRVKDEEQRPFLWRAKVSQIVEHAMFGCLVAGLLTTPLVVAQVMGRSIGAAGFAAVLALSVSMGAAEASLVWFRRRTTALMHRTVDFRRFASRAYALLLLGLGLFTAVAASLMALCSGVAVSTGAQLDPWPAAVSYLVLGAALFVSLVIRALGSSPVIVPALALALAVEIAFALIRVPVGTPLNAQAWVAGGLLVVLLLDGFRVLGDPGRHL